MPTPKNFPVLVSLFVLSSLLLAGCGGSAAAPTPTARIADPDNEEGGDDFIGVPNPASFYCQEMGYNLELRENDQGTAGICIFPDGTECEEWQFLAGGCAGEWSYCQRQGYTIQPGENMAVCQFSDGTTCSEYDYFIGECEPPQ